MRIFPLILALMILAGGCSSESEPDNAVFASIPEDGWPYGYSIELKLNSDSIDRSDVSRLAIRHNASYNYANIWVELTSIAPDSIFIDTVNIRLADKYGRSLGRGAGVSFLKIDTIPSHRASKVIIRHVMRVDTLRGIEQIAFIP